MNKVMFYLLPFLAITPIVASKPLPPVDAYHPFNILDHAKADDTSKAKVTSPKPIAGRNVSRLCIKVLKPISGQNISRLCVKVLKPIAGRNASRLRKQARERFFNRPK